MLDGYHLLTLTHRDTTLDNIGKVLVRHDNTEQFRSSLETLQQQFGWDELLYLSTCNRVFYLFYTPQMPAADTARQVLETVRFDLPAQEIDMLSGKMRLLHGTEAIQHLLEVAASMDSLVVGEREIIRQLREAYDTAHAWGLTGDHIRLLMRFTIETAKEVYSSTGIGEKALSVVALAFLAMQQSGLRRDARILMVGAGQTNALFAKFLSKYGYSNITVFNRTVEKAEALAGYLDGRALPLDALGYYSEGFDALVVCTGATQAVISPELYNKLLQGEKDKKVVIDLSVPNNIDKAVRDHFPVRFIEIDGLRDAAKDNLAHRERERAKAETLILARIQQFRAVWHERQVERALSHIPDEVRSVKERAMQEVFGKEMAMLSPEARELVEKMMTYMEKKCVAIPIKAAKQIVLNAAAKRMQQV